MDNNIKKYYKNVDQPLIDNYLSNEKFKNLLELSRKNDIPIFNKGKKKWKLKKSKQIINECKSKKKKKLQNLSKMIKELAKQPDYQTLKKIKIINKEVEDDINNIDNMIEEINISSNSKLSEKEEYLEVYEN